MAILYKNVKKKLQTSDTTILTPANATTAIIKSIVVCEQSNNGETLNVTITDTADTGKKVIKSVTIYRKHIFYAY